MIRRRLTNKLWPSCLFTGDWIFYMKDNEFTSFLQQTQPYVIEPNNVETVDLDYKLNHQKEEYAQPEAVHSKDIQDNIVLDDQDDENVQSDVSYHFKDIQDKNILDDQDYESVQCDVSSHLKDIQDDNISDDQVDENVQYDVPSQRHQGG